MSAGEWACLHDLRAANWIMIVVNATVGNVGAHNIARCVGEILACASRIKEIYE